MPDAPTPAPAPAAEDNRRPIGARDLRAMHALAAWLARAGVSPNAISVASIVFAGLGAWALLGLPPPWGPWLCAAAIVLRLLCNLFDGMVAVEWRRRTPLGGLYNEVPDRIADTVFLVALGHAAGLPWLGWCAALCAALTAYVRTLGGALGLAQDFRGPMAKQHRMWLMVAVLLAMPLAAWWWPRAAAMLPRVALWVLAAGALLTCVTRLRAVAAGLRARADIG